VGLLHAAGGWGRLPRSLDTERTNQSEKPYNRDRRIGIWDTTEIDTTELGENAREGGEKRGGGTNLGGELLPGGLAAGGLAGGLLGTGHLLLDFDELALASAAGLGAGTQTGKRRIE
jgi:hypothetical protein